MLQYADEFNLPNLATLVSGCSGRVRVLLISGPFVRMRSVGGRRCPTHALAI